MVAKAFGSGDDNLTKSTGAREGLTIRALVPADAPRCVEIISTLPEWFGYPSAHVDVEDAVLRQEGFVAELGGNPVAFIATKPSFPESLEITHLAVHVGHRHQGIGRSLVREVARRCETRNIPSICLLTLGPSSESVEYAETVSFYRSLGFWRTKEVQLSHWGGAPALVMVALSRELL